VVSSVLLKPKCTNKHNEKNFISNYSKFHLPNIGVLGFCRLAWLRGSSRYLPLAASTVAGQLRVPWNTAAPELWPRALPPEDDSTFELSARVLGSELRALLGANLEDGADVNRALLEEPCPSPDVKGDALRPQTLLLELAPLDLDRAARAGVGLRGIPCRGAFRAMKTCRRELDIQDRRGLLPPGSGGWGLLQDGQ
jgi:hypothetical protein